MSSNEKNSAANSAQDPNVIYYKDATELAALIRTKQLSSREVVQAHLDRISTVNPKINAIVTLMADDALKGAGVADEAVMSGAQLGPIHGVPFTIKDAIGFEIGPLFFGRGLTTGRHKKIDEPMQCDPSVILESNIASSEEQAPGIYQRPYHPQSVVWNLDDSVAPRRAEEEIRLLHLLEVLPLWRGITTHSVANQEDQDFKFLPALS